jgi:hypothetical protein
MREFRKIGTKADFGPAPTAVWASAGNVPAIATRGAFEFQELRAWLAEYEAEVRDQQFHSDARAGRLDAIADQALKDFSESRSTDL